MRTTVRISPASDTSEMKFAPVTRAGSTSAVWWRKTSRGRTKSGAKARNARTGGSSDSGSKSRGIASQCKGCSADGLEGTRSSNRPTVRKVKYPRWREASMARIPSIEWGKLTPFTTIWKDTSRRYSPITRRRNATDHDPSLSETAWDSSMKSRKIAHRLHSKVSTRGGS